MIDFIKEELDSLNFFDFIAIFAVFVFSAFNFFSEKSPEPPERLANIEKYIYYYTDPETNVQYIVIEKYGKMVITPRIDENGNLVLNPPALGK